MPRPITLYAVELPADSGEWHALSSPDVADALLGAGYAVERYVPVAERLEALETATSDRHYIRQVASINSVDEGEAQSIVRDFIAIVRRGRGSA